MQIVIAGGTGFLGAPLAAALAADGHDVVTLLARRPRRRPAAVARPWPWTPDGGSRRLGGGDRRRRTRSSTWPASRSPASAGPPRRSSASSTAASRRRAASSPRSTRGDAPPAGVRQRIGGRLLRPARRRDRHRGHAARQRLPRRRLRAVGSRGDARRRAPRRAWSACEPAWCSNATAARCRRCCRRSGSAPAGRSDRAGSTGRGFTATTGSVSCSWRSDTPTVAGPLNATAPNPVTNAEFARALGRALHRPAFMPAPGIRAAAAARRDGRRAAAVGPARRAGQGRAARLHVPVRDASTMRSRRSSR